MLLCIACGCGSGGHGALVGDADRPPTDARVFGGSSIGAGVHIGSGAVIDASIVMAGAVIGAGATVTRSAIGSEAVVGDGAVVVDSVLGDHARVAPGASPEPGTRVAAKA